uniref:Uncharacterized protein n=1 Tax=viral metagenome TaxID=1070528 RepID=A0A6C0B6I1_9ZZZZ
MNYDNDDDSDLDPLFEEEEENQQLDGPKQSGKYYIGACKLIKPDNYFFMLSTVSPILFLQYPLSVVQRYLESASIYYVNKPRINILKLLIQHNGSYTVLIKTHWISLIQRHWRSILRERQFIHRRRTSIVARRRFEMTGRYPPGLNVLPGLNGMMDAYTTS